MIRMIVKATMYYYESQCLFLVNIVLIISYIPTNLLCEVNFDIWDNFSRDDKLCEIRFNYKGEDEVFHWIGLESWKIDVKWVEDNFLVGDIKLLFLDDTMDDKDCREWWRL